MSKLPVLISLIGFVVDHQKGSHVILKHQDGRTTVVPMRPRETIDRGLLNKIIKKELSMERDEFMKYV